MPAKSLKQKRFMDAAAHSPAFAKKVGVPAKVAKEFSAEKYAKGGSVKQRGYGMARAGKKCKMV